MTSIIITGRPNSEEMSECILVAENISNMYPSSRFTVVLKSPKEWDQYCEDLCNLFGILKKTHPLILFSNGKKIGGAQDFFKLISDSFKYDKLIKKNDEYILDVDPSEITKLTKENTLLVEKEYTCRTSGIYIIDKINKKLEDIPDKKFIEIYNKYNTIETDYDSDLIDDMKVYVKYDNKFTPSPKDYKEYTEIVEERPAYADKEKYNAYHEELRLKKEEEERLKKEAEEEEKRKKEEEERLKEEALRAEEEKNDTEGSTSNKKNKEKKKKEEEKRKKEEEKRKKEEEERKKKEEEEKRKKEEEEKKKQEEEEKKKQEEETLKTENDQQQNTENKEKEGEGEEQVPEVKQIKYKRIFFKCYTDFDIPYEKFDKELIVENFSVFNYQLVINPYFTFFGETIINKIKDYEAPLLPEREEPIVEEDEPPQITTISAVDPNVTKDTKNNTQNKTTESDKNKDKKNIKNDNEKKETPQSTTENFKKDEKKPQQNTNNNVNNNTQQNDNKNNNNTQNEQKDENLPKPEIVYKGPTKSTEPNTYKPNFTEEKMPKDCLVLKDYGRLPSLRMIQFGGEDLRFYQEYIPPYQLSEHIKNTTNLFNFNKDTNIIDDKTLYSLIEMVNETDGYVTYRVLPYNYTDWKIFGSNTFKILPNKSRDIKNEEYPLVDKIKQMINKFKRELFNKSVENTGIDDSKNVELILHNDDFDQCFPPPEFFVIDVFQKHGIPHLVKTFTPGSFISVNLKFAINKICEKLEINNDTGYGFCLIICKKFVFVAPLKEPYTYTKGEINDKKEQISPRIPIFAEPYYFMGLFTLPYIESEWPESIKRKNVKFDLLDILKKSTN